MRKIGKKRILREKEKVLLTDRQIVGIVKTLGEKVSRDYAGKTLVMVGILKGSFIFLADLIREIKGVEVEVDFVRVRSYGSSTSPEQEPVLEKDLEVPLEGKEVLIVDDIIDTGETLEYLIKHILKKKPSTVKVCALIDKRERRKENIRIDYTGCTIEKGFVVGYGMDLAEKNRGLKEVKILEDTSDTH